MDENLPLLVPLSALSDFLHCAICMCYLDNARLTVCGHRYCEKCITEWVNRQHKCPCCNHPLTENQLIRDHQFDSLLSTIDAEKEKSESRYFETLIDAANSKTAGDDGHQMTPVELVLKKHLKKGVLEHEGYLQKLKKSFTTKMNVLETTTQKALVDLQTHGLSEQEVGLQTVDLHCTLERQKEDLRKQMDSCVQMVADAYDKYLCSHIPSLDVLPVVASIMLAKKNIKIADVTFQPSDTLQQVRESVEKAMIKRHNPVHCWEEDAKYFLFGPFAKCSECEMQKVIDDYQLSGNLIDDVQLLSEGSMLGLQYAIKPGSVILVAGGIKLESDLPKKCFAKVFKKGDDQQRVDYFSCSNCNFKWICRSCMEICHQGHDVAPYIMQHQPNWACCYCPKKKCCTIQAN